MSVYYFFYSTSLTNVDETTSDKVWFWVFLCSVKIGSWGFIHFQPDARHIFFRSKISTFSNRSFCSVSLECRCLASLNSRRRIIRPSPALDCEKVIWIFTLFDDDLNSAAAARAALDFCDFLCESWTTPPSKMNCDDNSENCSPVEPGTSRRWKKTRKMFTIYVITKTGSGTQFVDFEL